MGELLISKGADIHFSSLLNSTKKILAIEQTGGTPREKNFGCSERNFGESKKLEKAMQMKLKQ